MKKTAILLSCMALASCNVLKPVEDRSVNHVLEAAIPARSPMGNSPVIAVARPSLPGYIDRQQLVIRDGTGSLLMNANQIWAEPLDVGIARVTAENLGRIKNSLNVQPVQAFITVDYSHLLEIRVSRFDADEVSRMVLLECSWKLQPVSGRIATTRSFRIEVPIEDPDFTAKSPQEARVRAMNQALAALARDVARAL